MSRNCSSIGCLKGVQFHYWFQCYTVQNSYCQRGNRAKKRDCLGGRFKIPYNVGKNPQILRNPLKFAFLTIFGCKEDPILGQCRHGLVFTTRGSKLGDPVCSCSFSVQEDLTGEQALIRFLVLKGYYYSGLLYKLRLKQQLIKE